MYCPCRCAPLATCVRVYDGRKFNIYNPYALYYTSFVKISQLFVNTDSHPSTTYSTGMLPSDTYNGSIQQKWAFICWLGTECVLYKFSLFGFTLRCRRFKKYTYLTITNRACKSRARKRGWDNWGQEVHILHVNVNFVLFLVVLIELFQSNDFSYTLRRINTSRSSGTLYRWQWSRKSWLLIDCYGGCHGIAGLYLCLAILTNN